MSNEWFERGELPPVGVLCEFTWGNQSEWHECMRIDDDNVAFKWFAEWRIKQLCNAPSNLFRQIRTERERAIEAAIEAMLPGNAVIWNQ
jgi:hypothetical protein